MIGAETDSTHDLRDPILLLRTIGDAVDFKTFSYDFFYPLLGI